MGWQVIGLQSSMGVQADGSWAAQIAKWIVARQNGKGGGLELRQVWGLLLGRRRMVHTAHEFKTANKHFERVCGLIEEGHPSVRRRIKKILRGNNEKSIEMKDGSRLDFIARSRNSGRGLSADDLFLDEDMILTPATLAALLPVISASPNPQVIMAGTVPIEVTEESEYVFDLRDRSLSADPGSLCWMEWSADQDDDPDLDRVERDTVAVGICDDSAQWARANPSLGLLISEDYVAGERSVMPESLFRIERMSIWPKRPPKVGDGGFDATDWRLAGVRRDGVSMVDPPVFALDVSPGSDRASIAAGGWVQGVDGQMLGEIVAHGAGSGWCVDRLHELQGRHPGSVVVVDPRSAAGALIVDLVNAGVVFETMTTPDVAAACGLARRLVSDGDVSHLVDPVLDDAVRCATTRPLAGGVAWARAKGSGDITALVAWSNALWRARRLEASDEGTVVNLW